MDTLQRSEAFGEARNATATVQVAYMLGTAQLELLDFLTKVGVSLTDNPQKTNLWIIDAENVTAEDLQKVQPMLKKWQKKGGMLLVLSSGSRLSDAFCKWLPEDVRLTDRRDPPLKPMLILGLT